MPRVKKNMVRKRYNPVRRVKAGQKKEGATRKQNQINYQREFPAFGDISEHCLESICQFLDITDLANLVGVNMRMKGVVTRYAKRNMGNIIIQLLALPVLKFLDVVTSFDYVRDYATDKYRIVKIDNIGLNSEITNEIDLQKLSIFAERFGRYIRIFHLVGLNEYATTHSLVREMYYSDVVDVISRHCPNLIGFTFDGCHRLDPNSILYLSRMVNIKMLTIRNCGVTFQFRADHMEGVLVDLPQLVSLQLEDCYEIIDCRNHFPKLRSFSQIGMHWQIVRRMLDFMCRHPLEEITFNAIDCLPVVIRKVAQITSLKKVTVTAQCQHCLYDYKAMKDNFANIVVDNHCSCVTDDNN